MPSNSVGIDRALRDLDEEWNIERMLEANAASAALAGTITPRCTSVGSCCCAYGGLPAAARCSHRTILRRMGYRTARGIETERIALKALQGDFGNIAPGAFERDNTASKNHNDPLHSRGLTLNAGHAPDAAPVLRHFNFHPRNSSSTTSHSGLSKSNRARSEPWSR